MSRFLSKPSWSRPTNTTKEDLFHKSGQSYDRFAQALQRKQRASEQKGESGQAVPNEGKSPKRRKVETHGDGDEDSLDDEEEDEDDDDDDDDDDDEEEKETGEGYNKSSTIKGQSRKQSTRTHQEEDLVDSVQVGEDEVQFLAESPLKHSLHSSASATNETGRVRSSLQSSYQTQLASRNDGSKGCYRREDSGDAYIYDTRSSAVQAGSPGVVSDDIIEVHGPNVPEKDGNDTDEEFPELARQAREKVKRMRLEAEAQNSPSFSPPGSQKPISGRAHGGVQSGLTRTEGSQPPPTPEPVLSILISSSIPGTRPIAVKRRLDHRLKDARMAWIDKMGLGDRADEIFLVWRGTRLWDVTTCKSLGIGVDEDGYVTTGKGLLEEGQEYFQVEAMTAEIFKAFKSAKRAGTTAGNNINDHEIEDVHEDAAPPKETPQVRIVLRSKEFPDFRVMVKLVSCCHSQAV